MKSFFANKNRGQYEGKRLYPHLHQDGTYVATNSKHSVDYVRVTSIEELSALVRSGYGARMSNPEIKQAPSYISHKRIIFEHNESPLIELEKHLKSFADSEHLDQTTVASNRKEQAFLRSYLLQGKRNGHCILCGRNFPAELLIAAHIKPRAKCTRNEKLDFKNIAALMCVLGCDSLFEKGFIIVSGGVVRANPHRKATQHLQEAIKKLADRDVTNWHDSSKYYNWHAREFGWKEE